MAEGWIKLHRKITNSPLWDSEPFTRGQAWIDLILIANHKDGYIRVNGKRVDVMRGQVGMSEIKLSQRWKWSRGKTKRFLKELICDEQIVQQTEQGSSVITICNYCEYQNGSTAGEQGTVQQTVQQTDRQRDTNKNDNNDNKINGDFFGVENPPQETSQYTSEFELVWKSLPTRIENNKNKVGNKKRASKHFLNLTKNHTVDVIIKSARDYANAQKGKEAQYIKTKENWLRDFTVDEISQKKTSIFGNAKQLNI